MPRPARTSARCESNSSEVCAISGSRPVPSYIRVSHCRQIVPSGVAIQPSSTRSCGVSARRPASGWSWRRMTSATSVPTVVAATWSGIPRGTSPQLCATPRSVAPVATRPAVSQGSRSESATVRPGWAASTPGSAGATRPRIAVEKAVSRTSPATVPAWRRRLASSRSRSVSNRPPWSTRWRPCRVSITPRPTRSSSGTPVCRSRRLTCWETALGVKPRAAAAATTEPWLSTARSEATASRSIM